MRVTARVASMAAMKLAVEHVRRMRGGAQSQLMRCEDDAYYIVKFQNNPQHLRILANEMLATRLAARLGLCVPQVEVVEVRPEIIAYTPELVIQLGLGRKPCAAGKQFGSQFPGHPARLTVHDFLPDEQLRCGPESFGFSRRPGLRQVDLQHERPAGDFFSRPRRVHRAHPDSAAGGSAELSYAASGYTAMMIDFGFCFNAGEWDFPDAPLRGLYARHRVYDGVAGMEAFEPWLARLENRITERVLGEEAAQIPPEWYGGDWDALERLLERLYRRRERVRELLLSARNSGRDPFPNWKVKYA